MEQLSNGALFELINAAGDGVIVAERSGRFVSMNQAGARLFGYADPTAALAGLSPDFLAGALQWERLVSQADVSDEAISAVATLRRTDGEAVLVKLIVRPNMAGSGYLCLMRDITGESALAQNLVERNAELEMLRNLAVESMRVADQEILLDSMVRLCARASGANGGAIFLYNPATKCLELRASVGMSDLYRDAVSVLRLGEGIAGKVAVSRSPILIDDLASNPDAATPEIARHEAIRNFAGFPLLVGSRLLGVIFFFTRESAALTGRDFSLLNLLSAQVSLSLDHIMRTEEVRERNEELEDFNRLAVDRELRMIELKKRIRELESKLALG